MYSIRDCLSDIEIGTEDDKAKADAICQVHGGADNCIHVFESEEPARKSGALTLFG